MMDIQKHNFSSIQKIQGQYILPKKTGNVQPSPSSFNEILARQQKAAAADLKFSKHANERLESRNISLTANQLERLEKGVEKAEEKGIGESLVLMDNMAFLVSVKNKTVITAMEQGDTQEKIFTNIDGAVIL